MQTIEMFFFQGKRGKDGAPGDPGAKGDSGLNGNPGAPGFNGAEVGIIKKTRYHSSYDDLYVKSGIH